jgi:hypothetical protein
MPTWIDKRVDRTLETYEAHVLGHDVSLGAQRKDISERKHLGRFFLENRRLFCDTFVSIELFHKLTQHLNILDVLVSKLVDETQHETRLFLFGVKIQVPCQYFGHFLDVINLEFINRIVHVVFWDGAGILLEFQDVSQSKKTVVRVHHLNLCTMVVFFVEFGEIHLCKNNVTSL